MSGLRRHPLVERDIESYAHWYEERSPGLGTQFVEEVHRVFEVITGNPKRYGVRLGQWRRANLQRFPHAVFYQLYGEEPVIFAVLHASRDHRTILEGRISGEPSG